jgi:hypothetical protein
MKPRATAMPESQRNIGFIYFSIIKEYQVAGLNESIGASGHLNQK